METDEILTGVMRPGNAGSNTAADHVTVLADAIAQLPPAWQSGHSTGDAVDLVKHPILVRADGAGASHWFAEDCVERNLQFTFCYQIDNRVRDGVIGVPTGCWHPAVEADGRRRDGAQVIELTSLVNMDGWPTGTRLIVRRERPIPARNSRCSTPSKGSGTQRSSRTNPAPMSPGSSFANANAVPRRA